MLLASCSKDEAAVTSNEALVTFNVAAADMGTRAYGDGVTAHDLEYAIYEKGSYAQPLIAKELQGVFPGDVKQTAFTEKLVKGKTYIALFWADAEVDPYTVDWNNQTVKITDPAALESQDENLDAFFKAHEIVVGQDAQTETIELRRPFAQLNVGTADTADAATAGLVVEQTEVAVRAYTTLNLLNGEVADAMMLTYKMANIPSGENETFTVNGKVYDHLSMNYLLVNAKELVDVTFTVNDGTQNINTSTFAKVPVERNFKTFIIGNLLTSDVNFDVILLPDYWKTPDYIWPDPQNPSGSIDGAVVTTTVKVDANTPLSEVVTIIVDGQSQRFEGVSIKNSTVTASPAIESEVATTFYFENVILEGNGVDAPVNGTYFFKGCDFKSGTTIVTSTTGQVLFYYPIDCTIDGQPATFAELSAMCNCPATIAQW